MTISDINFTIGSVNPSGITDEIYFCPKQFITAWPTISNDFTSATGAATYAGYTGSFTMDTGKTFSRQLLSVRPEVFRQQRADVSR